MEVDDGSLIINDTIRRAIIASNGQLHGSYTDSATQIRITGDFTCVNGFVNGTGCIYYQLNSYHINITDNTIGLLTCRISDFTYSNNKLTIDSQTYPAEFWDWEIISYINGFYCTICIGTGLVKARKKLLDLKLFRSLEIIRLVVRRCHQYYLLSPLS